MEWTAVPVFQASVNGLWPAGGLPSFVTEFFCFFFGASRLSPRFRFGCSVSRSI